MQRIRDGHRWMLRLDDGQDLFEALSGFASSEGIRAGVVVSGIGMLRRASIGYWNGQRYEPRDLSEPHELVALHGSIGVADGKPSVHLHVAASDRDHRTTSGHLLAGTIGVVGEIYVETFPERTFARPLNESFGLRTLDLEPGPDP